MGDALRRFRELTGRKIPSANSDNSANRGGSEAIGTNGTNVMALPDHGRGEVYQYEGSAPPAWSAAFLQLCALPCPDWLSHDRWMAILNGGGVFLDKWAQPAAALRWDAREFYGLGNDGSSPTYQPGGLVGVLADVTVRAVTANGVTVQFADGSTRTIRKGRAGWYWD